MHNKDPQKGAVNFGQSYESRMIRALLKGADIGILQDFLLILCLSKYGNTSLLFSPYLRFNCHRLG